MYYNMAAMTATLNRNNSVNFVLFKCKLMNNMLQCRRSRSRVNVNAEGCPVITKI